MTSALFQKEERTGNTKIENINECAKKAFLFIKRKSKKKHKRS